MNHRFTRYTAALFAAVISMSLLSGCSLPAKKQESSGAGYLFTVSLPANPKSLDPQTATDAASKTIISNLYEGLMELDENGVPQTAGAASYTVSPDNRTYTFTLKGDRYWYFDENENDIIDDGESWLVTAADYSYAFRRIFDPNTQSPYAETFSCIAGAADALQGKNTEIGVRALSNTTLEFTLEKPCAEFLSLLASTGAMPCNEAFFLKTKGKYGLDQKAVASCGAFYLRLWFYDPYGKDNLIYMRRNSTNTPARSVYPSNLTFQIEKTANAAEASFSEGTSDVLTTSVWQNDYQNTEKYHVSAFRATTLGLVFNPDDRVFANQNIRKGLSMAIDRSTLGAESENDLTGASGIIPPAVHMGGKYYRELVAEPTLYQPEDALATFQKGMTELGIASIDTTKILVCPSLMTCDHLHDIIQVWQEVFGFYIGIEEVSEEDYLERMANKNYTIAVCGITADSDSPASMLNQFHSDNNSFYYKNASVDTLLDQLPQCETEEILQQECASLEAILTDEAMFLPMFYKNQYCVTRSNNTDIRFDPFSGALNFRDAKHFE